MRKSGVYENRIISLIEDLTGLYGQRGTNSYGIDILLFQDSTDGIFSPSMRGEVKTSKSTKMWLRSPREKKQYEDYMNIYRVHNATTVYFFRIISGGKKIVIKRRGKEELIIPVNSEIDRWRVFFVEGLPLTDSGYPMLDFANGLPVKDFCDSINEIMENRN